MAQRVRAIDGLRGLAILMVTAFHLWRAAGRPDLGALTPLAPWGASYVSLFLAISGFCLYRQWLAQPLPALQFYRRRLARLLPPYYLALAVMTAVWLLSGRGAGISAKHWAVQLLVHATFTHTLLADGAFRIATVFWFIGVLVHLYLLFPLLAPLVRGRPWLMAAAAWAASVTYSAGLGRLEIASTATYLGAFVCGMAAGHLAASQKRLPRWLPLVGWTALLAAPFLHAVAHPGWIHWWGDPLFAPCWAALPLSAATLGSRLFTWRPLAWVGAISYSMYLYNDLFAWVPLWAYPPVVVAAGAAGWWLVERPLQRRRRVSYRGVRG